MLVIFGVPADVLNDIRRHLKCFLVGLLLICRPDPRPPATFLHLSPSNSIKTAKVDGTQRYFKINRAKWHSLTSNSSRCTRFERNPSVSATSASANSISWSSHRIPMALCMLTTQQGVIDDILLWSKSFLCKLFSSANPRQTNYKLFEGARCPVMSSPRWRNEENCSSERKTRGSEWNVGMFALQNVL